MAAYSYDIEYPASKYHGYADALSRLLRKTTEEADDWSMEGDPVNRFQIESTPITARRIRKATRGDPVLSRVSCMVGQKKYPGGASILTCQTTVQNEACRDPEI